MATPLTLTPSHKGRGKRATQSSVLSPQSLICWLRANERLWLHAARLQAAGERLRESIGASPTEAGKSAYAMMLAESGTAADAPGFAAAWAEGAAMSLDEAVAYALGDEEPAKVAKLPPTRYNYAY